MLRTIVRYETEQTICCENVNKHFFQDVDDENK